MALSIVFNSITRQARGLKDTKLKNMNILSARGRWPIEKGLKMHKETKLNAKVHYMNDEIILR